ncbi:RSC58 (YLR033W) [Zygosaccharomyces parabailii]|nr:RSC58 (YLR033W) [Zygosaccharomyces parabailii]
MVDFDDVLSSIHAILKAASSKCKVLDESFPAKFFEPNPDSIFDSYYKFIRNRSNNEGIIKNEDKLALTTISQQFENGEYAADRGGFYRLYHDIHLVCSMLIHYYPQGTRNYQMVDKFNKFATELLLRECYKVGVLLMQVNPEEYASKAEEKTELDRIIARDFIKISTNYKVPIVKTYHIKTKDLDLFSSVISKSCLDRRPQELPNSNFEINKVILQSNMCEDAPRLGFIAANTSNIPDPTLPPTEMMTRFLHPNWYALPTTMWLDYGDYKSWAPSFNENGTVIDSTTRGIIWLERVGYMELLRKISREEKNEDEADVGDAEDISAEKRENKQHSTDSSENQEVGDSERNGEITESSSIPEDGAENGKQKELTNLKPPVIKLENLLQWSPANYLDDESVTSFKEGLQSELITKTLLRIRTIRKNRVKNKVGKPSAEETKLYNKARRLMKEVILTKQVSRLPMNHCKSFPVLQANYNGSIPVVRTQPTRKRKHKRI